MGSTSTSRARSSRTWRSRWPSETGSRSIPEWPGRFATADNVLRAEILFDPQSHTGRGVDLGAVVRGLSRACRDARASGVDAALILGFLRHLDEAAAYRMARNGITSSFAGPEENRRLVESLDAFTGSFR